MVDGDVDGEGGEASGVADTKEEGVVPVGGAVGGLGGGALLLVVEFDLDEGVAGGSAVLGREVGGVGDLDGELHVDLCVVWWLLAVRSRRSVGV